MVRVQRVIPAVLAEVIRKAPLCPEKVSFAWREAVGPVMGRVTSARLDAHGILHVTAADIHWEREVKRSARLILPRLSRLLGEDVVKRIRASSNPPT